MWNIRFMMWGFKFRKFLDDLRLGPYFLSERAETFFGWVIGLTLLVDMLYLMTLHFLVTSSGWQGREPNIDAITITILIGWSLVTIGLLFLTRMYVRREKRVIVDVVAVLGEARAEG